MIHSARPPPNWIVPGAGSVNRGTGTQSSVLTALLIRWKISLRQPPPAALAQQSGPFSRWEQHALTPPNFPFLLLLAWGLGRDGVMWPEKGPWRRGCGQRAGSPGEGRVPGWRPRLCLPPPHLSIEQVLRTQPWPERREAGGAADSSLRTQSLAQANPAQIWPRVTGMCGGRVPSGSYRAGDWRPWEGSSRLA